MKKIKDDANVFPTVKTIPVPDNAKLQREAAETVIDETGRAPQFKPMAINVTDPNSSLAMKIDGKTYPGSQLRKEPTKLVQGIQPGQKDPNTISPEY
jgi:hypothetical protein